MFAIFSYFKHPKALLVSLLQHFGNWLPDKIYIKWMYRLKMGRKLNIDYPKRFTEKLQWLKLYDHDPFYSIIVDKYEVKSYVARLIGMDYVIPTIGVWNEPEEIKIETMPEKFVLKTTNGGGGTGVVICKEKSKFNFNAAVIKLRKSLNTNLYKLQREWPYKNIPPRIIAEKYMEDESGELRDYKFYCFNGEPKVLLIASNRFTNHNFNYYDMKFNPLPIHSAVGGKSDIVFQRPSSFDEMVELSRKLSQGFVHVRVDLYYVDQKIYFGELTLYDSSGYDNLSSDSEDLLWGSWLQLPVIKE